MESFRSALGLTPERVRELVRLAGRAPSPHNREPWRFRLPSQLIEMHFDPQSRSRIRTTGRCAWGAARLC